MDCTKSCWQLVELKTLERLGGFPKTGVDVFLGSLQ